MKGIPLLLIEDSVLFQSALQTVLSRSGFAVATCNSKEAVERQAPEAGVVLFDIVTFADDKEQMEDLIQRYAPHAPLLLLGRDDRIEQLLIGLRAGACGCINQTVSPRQLQEAVSAVLAGGTWCEKTFFQRILQSLPLLSPLGERRLTKREQEVLHCLVRGHTNKEIARTLGLTEQAVKVHVSNLLRKTGMPNRAGLLLYAVRHGLVRA